MLRKILWGVLAVAPWWGFFLFSAVVWRGGVSPTFWRRDFFVFGNVLFLSVLLCFLLRVNSLKTADREKKWLWRGLLIFGHVFAIPLFWYFHIWRESNDPEEPEPEAQPR